MTDFPSNSKKSQEPPKKLQPVVSAGTAKKREKKLGTRIKESFSGEKPEIVAQHVLFDVLIPATQNLIVEMGKEALDRLFFGQVRGVAGRRTGANPPQYVSYNKIASAVPDPRADISTRARAAHDFSEIVLADRGEAEIVMDAMADRIAKYDIASVADLYELVNLPSTFVDQKWGWSDLSSAYVKRDAQGYILKFPAPDQLR